VNDPKFPVFVVKIVAVFSIVLVIFLGERKIISEEFVVYGCVGAVALAAGYLLLTHLD